MSLEHGLLTPLKSLATNERGPENGATECIGGSEPPARSDHTTTPRKGVIMGCGMDISLAATPPASGAESFPLPTRLDTVPKAPCWLVDRIRGEGKAVALAAPHAAEGVGEAAA
jgi:hypothetical protein